MTIPTKKLVFPRVRAIPQFSLFGGHFYVDILRLVMESHDKINVIETGCLNGYTTKILLDAIRETGKPLSYYAVDPYSSESTGLVHNESALERFRKNAPQAQLFRKYSHDFWLEDKAKMEPLCFALLDGAHDVPGESEDVLEVLECMKSLSVIVLDDTEATGNGVLDKVGSLVKANGYRVYDVSYPTMSKAQLLMVRDVSHDEIVRIARFHGGKFKE